MQKTELATIVLALLGEKAVACEDIAPNEVIVEVEDIDQEIHGKEMCIYLREGLLMHGYEEIEFEFDDVDDNVLIVSALQVRNDEEVRTRLVTTVLTLLGDNVIEHEIFYPNSITMNLVNCNRKYAGKDMLTYLKEELLMHDFEDIKISFGNGHWTTVEAVDLKALLAEPSRLTTTVLTLLREQVLEFEVYQSESITLNLVNVNKQFNGKDVLAYLKEVLDMHGFEKIHFNVGNDNWITVFAKDRRDMFAKKSKLTTVLLTLLRGAVVEFEEFKQDMIAVNLIDCNMKFQDKDVTIYLKEGLLLQGFEDIQFTFGDGHWLIVEAQEPQDDAVELSKLATTVLTVLGNNVYEYAQYYPESISINFVDCNKKIVGKDLRTYLEDVLEIQGFEDVRFCGDNGHWDTVFATEPQHFTTVDLETVVLTLLGNEILGYENNNAFSLSINLADCNNTIGGKDVATYLQETLRLFGYDELQFNFGDGNWLTIVAKQPQTF